MKFKRLHESERNDIIELMKDNMQYENEPYVGPFWYDTEKEELYGVVMTLASDIPFTKSYQFNDYIRTGRKLHQDIWKEKARISKDKRFQGDYTMKPRGRVFEFKNKGFIVFVGEWINDYPEAKDIILAEFDLPENTQFIIDRHWDLGHGWSEEF